MDRWKNVRKALAGGVFALGTGIGTAAAQDGISQNEWWIIVAGVLITVGGVWYIPNEPTP